MKLVCVQACAALMCFQFFSCLIPGVPPPSLPGATMGEPTHDKGHAEET